MFLIEIANGNLLSGLVPESGALLLCGISLIGGAVAARKFLKRKDVGKRNGGNDNISAEK